MKGVQTVTKARDAANAFADAVGEDRESIDVLDPQWRELLTAAVAVTIHATGWRAETTWSLDDMGIQAESAQERAAVERVVRPGAIMLLPKAVRDRAQALRMAFRAALWDRAFKKTPWGPLVPKHKFSEWKKQATQIQSAYAEFAQIVAQHWSEYQEQTEADVRVVGRQSYYRLVAIGKGPAMAEGEWVERFTNRVMRKLISREEWLQRNQLWWDKPAYIPVATLLEAQQSADIRDALIAEAKTEMERDVLMGRAEQIDKGLFQFVAAVRGELVTRVFNVCQDVLKAVETGDSALPRNSSKQLKNLIASVNDLKFWDDAELERQMAEIQKLLDVPYNQRESSDVMKLMQQIGSEARDLLGTLNRPLDRLNKATMSLPEDDGELLGTSRQNRAVSDVEWDDLVIPTTQRQNRNSGVVAA